MWSWVISTRNIWWVANQDWREPSRDALQEKVVIHSILNWPQYGAHQIAAANMIRAIKAVPVNVAVIHVSTHCSHLAATDHCSPQR